MKRSARRKTRSVTSPPIATPPAGDELGLERSHALLVGCAVALVTATPLIASEGAVAFGTHVVLVMGWLLLTIVWLARCLLQPCPVWHIGPSGAALVLFLIAHSVSAVVMLHAGHARSALNALWLWVSFGLAFLTVRQLIRSGSQQRAVCSMLIALSVGMAAYGMYQVAYSNPHQREAYAKDPDAFLRRQNAYSPPGSPERRHFENRLTSTEPIGPFALTNSLAGFLTPCFLLLVACTAQLWFVAALPVWHRGGLVLIALLAGGCLLLTKSRAAYLATVIGLGLLVASQTAIRSRLRWRWLLPAAVAVIGIAAIAAPLGGLDRQVLTEAPKSLLYRLQYWRSTSEMIADHPWFGCGPGNFKEYYTQYKLPEASETVADPHNFLFEVAATAGLPALVLFSLVGVVVVWQTRSRATRSQIAPQNKRPRGSPDASDAGARRHGPVYVGFLVGFLLTYPAGWAGGQTPPPELLWISLPVALGTLGLLHSWVVGGTISTGLLLIATGSLLVNLLAAGGIGYPGVAEVLWILLALTLNAAESPTDDRQPTGPTPVAGRRVVAAGLAFSLILGLLGYRTSYRPVLGARGYYAQAEEDHGKALRSEVSPELVKEKCCAAAETDPWWADPCELWAQVLFEQWVFDQSDSRLAEFDQAVASMLRRNAHSSNLYRRGGDWLIEMYAVSGREDLLVCAIEAYRRASALYPNSSVLRAQLAWAYHLAGDRPPAERLAAEALRLDQMMPYDELRLRNQQLAGRRPLLIKGGASSAQQRCGSRTKNGEYP